MVRSVNSFLFIILLGLGTLTGCQIEDYPSELEIDPDSLAPVPQTIVAPCSYADSGEVENEYKMSGKMNKSILNFGNRKDVRLAFYGATNQIHISLFGGWELSDLKSQVVDFAKPSNPTITMEVVYNNFNGWQTLYTAVSGKLYIIKQNDGTYKYDWCEVFFQDPQDQSTRRSHGGFVLKP